MHAYVRVCVPTCGCVFHTCVAVASHTASVCFMQLSQKSAHVASCILCKHHANVYHADISDTPLYCRHSFASLKDQFLCSYPPPTSATVGQIYVYRTIHDRMFVGLAITIHIHTYHTYIHIPYIHIHRIRPYIS